MSLPTKKFSLRFDKKIFINSSAVGGTTGALTCMVDTEKIYAFTLHKQTNQGDVPMSNK